MKIIIQEWIRQANEFFKSLVFLDSEDIHWEKGASGYKAYLRDKPKSASSVTSAASGADVYPCKITGGSTAAGYTVDIYGDGYDAVATNTGTLQVLDLAQSDDVPVGTRVLGHSTSLTITGGSEV